MRILNYVKNVIADVNNVMDHLKTVWNVKFLKEGNIFYLIVAVNNKDFLRLFLKMIKVKNKKHVKNVKYNVVLVIMLILV